MNTLRIFVLFSLIFALALADFQVSKRLRGYTEAPDFLTLQIKNTDCATFLSPTGLSRSIKGGYSGHCLPINENGEDRDDLTFTGRCLKVGSSIILSIVEVEKKRSVKREAPVAPAASTPLQQPSMQLRDVIPKKQEAERKERREITQFYLSFQSSSRVDYEILSFQLKGPYSGHSYEARRPSCLKAVDYCLPSYHDKKDEASKVEKNAPHFTSHMVIDCDQTPLASGCAQPDERVYIEITRRDDRPDTCKNPTKARCCKYVNPIPTGGICTVYSPAKRAVVEPEKKQEEKAEPEKKQEPVKTPAKPAHPAQAEETEEEEIDPADKVEQKKDNQKRVSPASGAQPEETTEGDEVEFFEEEEEERTDGGVHTAPEVPAQAKKEEATPQAKKEEIHQDKKEETHLQLQEEAHEDKKETHEEVHTQAQVIQQPAPEAKKDTVVVPVAVVPVAAVQPVDQHQTIVQATH